MFSYYGSKSKVVDYYPPPKFDKIIEPFAGSARYSLKYWDRDILLVDKYNEIINIWEYLQNASKEDILRLPILKAGEDIRTYNLSEEELKFMRWNLGQGISHPSWICTPMTARSNQIYTRNRIANDLYKIKHWKLQLGDYKDLDNEDATWFIDPPYQIGGHHYKESNKQIDFKSLAEWCKTRNGQSIVCENTKATWLDFKPMIDMKGTMFKTTEAIWINYPTNYDMVQMSLL